MNCAAEYILSSYSFINTCPINQILNVGIGKKDGNPIPSFDEELLIELCSDAQQIFKSEENIIELEGDFIIVGDIHGSIHDLLRILKYIQYNKSKVLFLGDYIDRGNFSLECVTILFAYKILYKDRIFLIRGNHEFDSICSKYGFLDEIINYHDPKKIKANQDLKEQKQNSEFESYNAVHKEMDCYQYTINLFFAFVDTFSYLPIGAIINQNNFCIHGGLSPDLEKLDQIRNDIVRPIKDFQENQLLSDIVWSDPSSCISTEFAASPRGRGYLFSQAAVDHFLKENSLKKIIRGHECVKDGISSSFNEKCITVFSASSYNPDVNNGSGLMKLFQKDDKIEYVNFPPIDRLEKTEAVYFKVQAFHESSHKMTKFISLRYPSLTTNFNLKMIRNNSFKPSNNRAKARPKINSLLANKSRKTTFGNLPLKLPPQVVDNGPCTVPGRFDECNTNDVDNRNVNSDNMGNNLINLYYNM